MIDHEYKRCRRVISWMLTAHATLRDRYVRRARLLTLVVLALSIIGLLLALANDDQQVSLLGLDGRLQIFLAALAAGTFFISLLDLVIGWPGRAAAHADAARQLGELKLLFVRAVEEQGSWGVPDKDLTSEYERVMAAIPPIPDMKAASLKALHNRKHEVFRRADQHPGAPVWWLRLQVLRDSVRSSAGPATPPSAAPMPDTLPASTPPTAAPPGPPGPPGTGP